MRTIIDDRVDQLTEFLLEADQRYGRLGINERIRRVGRDGGNYAKMTDQLAKWLARELLDHGVRP